MYRQTAKGIYKYGMVIFIYDRHAPRRPMFSNSLPPLSSLLPSFSMENKIPIGSNHMLIPEMRDNGRLKLVGVSVGTKRNIKQM